VFDAHDASDDARNHSWTTLCGNGEDREGQADRSPCLVYNGGRNESNQRGIAVDRYTSDTV
jgi:hypothetical protein